MYFIQGPANWYLGVYSSDVWLPFIGCGSHGSGHTKGDVGKVGWSADSQSNNTTSAASAVSTANDNNYDSDSTIAYDLEEVMNTEYENNSNHRNNIPASIDEVIREITPVAWLDNPLPRPEHVVNDNYSPTSPVYNPDHSPIQIDSDEEEVESRANLSPAPLEIPMVTPAEGYFRIRQLWFRSWFWGGDWGQKYSNWISQYWQASY